MSFCQKHQCENKKQKQRIKQKKNFDGHVFLTGLLNKYLVTRRQAVGRKQQSMSQQRADNGEYTDEETNINF